LCYLWCLLCYLWCFLCYLWFLPDECSMLMCLATLQPLSFGLTYNLYEYNLFSSLLVLTSITSLGLRS
jgi:hypothetical protein